ncbi:MAG: hypothetical protein LBJ00_04225 [Planctomycetaceae bacterium]|jgi:hypothetical protein|nr:hypothetical protein [Planctomycetaceae bacterium]
MKQSELKKCAGEGQCVCGCSGDEQVDNSFFQDPVVLRLCTMYRDLLLHDGFGELRVDVKILKRGQKEVIVKSGKEYRYVVDVPGELNRWE